MSTESNHSGDNSYQARSAQATPDGWPGAAPPAGWFLRLPATARLGSPPPDRPGDGRIPGEPGGDPGNDRAGDPGDELDDDLTGPISWHEDMDQAGPEPEPDPEPLPRSVPAPPPVVSPTRALRGRPGGPGFQPRRPAADARKLPPPQSPWQASHRIWSESEIPWEQHPASQQPPQEPWPPEAWPREAWPREAWPHEAGRPQARPPIPPPRSRPAVRGSEPVTAPRPAAARVPLGAPVYAEPHPRPAGEPGPQRPPSRRPEPRAADPGTMLLEPDLPGTWRPARYRSRLLRRMATIVIPVAVLVAVAVLALALLTGHGPKLGPLAASQPDNAAPHQGTTALTIGTYPGQQARGVFQTVNRIVASGQTIVAMGSQTSDGVVRQQFFVSADGGATWRLAPVQAAGGGQPPLGYPAARLAGGPGGWLAVGPQAIWTSPNGLSWTLAATHGITPMRPGDGMWVMNSTSSGFLAAGVAATSGSQTQAVLWTSPDGLTWQRHTAAQLGLAGPGETVQSISYITARGSDTLISGQVSRDGASYAGLWLSTDGGAAWTRVTVPADHGAGSAITGLAFDSAGLLAVRPGRSANGSPDAVAYFSPNGAAWQYAGTIGASAGWTPGLVKGSDYGFVVAGTSGTGQLVAYTATGAGTNWRPTASLGRASQESVVGATAASADTIVAVGYTGQAQAGQQPVFLEATAAGRVQPVALASLPGGSIPELAVNGLAVAAGQQIAVGSADGYPAVWRRAAGGSWALLTSLPQVSGNAGLTALTGVAHGPAGWLAVGTPGPVVMTSADGTSWTSAAGSGSITADLAGVAAVATAAGPHGYVIVGKLVAPGGACVADVWFSPDLKSWTRAHDVNDATGSSQVLAVAAGAAGFVSVGSHDGKPAVWTTANGTSWTTIVLPVPAGASSAVLQQVAISGDRVVAAGQASSPAGTVPIAELSLDGGLTWQQAPISTPGQGTTFTALTAGPGGFTAAAQFGAPGQQEIAVWRSATGTSWTATSVSGVTGTQAGGSYRLSALVPSATAVTGIGSLATQASQEVFTTSIPTR
jgi:hypothetical protein